MTLDDAFQDPTAVTVEIAFPDTPFGGVQIFGAADNTIQIEFVTEGGAPVQSVFGRIGNVVALCSDYASCYSPIGRELPPDGLSGYQLAKLSNSDFDVGWVPAVNAIFTLDLIAGNGLGGILDSGIPPLDVARLSLPNVFQKVNTIPGIRFSKKKVTTDYHVSAIDFEIRADASDGPLTVFLTAALGSSQVYYVKKIDNTANEVTVMPEAGDLIDGNPLFSLSVTDADICVMDGDLHVWDKMGVGIQDIAGIPDLSDFARKSLSNIFLDLNTFTGVRFSSIAVTEDYDLTPLDFRVGADATGGPVALNLPPATGSGQLYFLRKLDNTDNIVTINRAGTDTIDGVISINLVDQWASSLLFDGAPGQWDDVGKITEGGGGITPFPTRPTTLNEVIAAGVAIGLWP